MALRILSITTVSSYVFGRTSDSLAPANSISTVLGPPEVIGGPTCCMFDSPFLGLLRNDNVTIGFTSNSDTYMWSEGPTIDSVLIPPPNIGLNATQNVSSYSHCGKWLNAAWVDETGTVHGYFHEEWQCNYTNGGYTNKSVGYASSIDGGHSWTVSQYQLIAGENSTSAHQTGEGDHSVVRVGDFLYLYFLEWDAPTSIHGGTSSGVARSHTMDAGTPGTWYKFYNGSWDSPGVGGPADTVEMPGTAVYAVPDVEALLAIGVIWSAPCEVSWSLDTDGLNWTLASAGPLFHAGESSWDRDVNSSELFAYPSMSGPQGAMGGLPAAESWLYFTYLAPGTDFSHRWLVRRRVQIVTGTGCGMGAPPALAALSLWASNSTPPNFWPASGPVLPISGYNLSTALVAYLTTNAPPAPAPPMLALLECSLAGTLVVVLTLPNECGSGGVGAFTGSTVLRTAGWVAKTAGDADALGWHAVQQPGEGGGTLASHAGALYRCVRTLSGNRAGSAAAYSVSFDDPGCTTAGPGFGPDMLLGYALSALR